MSDAPGIYGLAPTRQLQEKLPDISKWLVTKNNPPREGIGFDYERCAVLHNYILTYVVERTKLHLEKDVRSPVAWYDGLPVSEHPNFNQNMRPEVIGFLKRALHHRQLGFFYGKAGLNTHEGMIASLGAERR
ncbi:hypothetical protein DL98DRAFT_521197 [Cadophora sp. DSE1049]|nr:hypothetical protein DL98DRAFT_521197 [Cadophora sp. DSE1049]